MIKVEELTKELHNYIRTELDIPADAVIAASHSYSGLTEGPVEQLGKITLENIVITIVKR